MLTSQVCSFVGALRLLMIIISLLFFDNVEESSQRGEGSAFFFCGAAREQVE